MWQVVKWCWLEKAGITSLTALEQPAEASLTVLVRKSWPESTFEVGEYFVGSERVLRARMARAATNWHSFCLARIISWGHRAHYTLDFDMQGKLEILTVCSRVCLEGNWPV
jgi:hypothetical protein